MTTEGLIMEGRLIRTPDELHDALKASTTRREAVAAWRDAVKHPAMADHLHMPCCDRIIRRVAKKWVDRS